MCQLLHNNTIFFLANYNIKSDYVFKREGKARFSNVIN